MKCITDKRLIDYLSLNGIKPIEEYNGYCYYKKSDSLFSLLESYYIRYVAFKNKGWK